MKEKVLLGMSGGVDSSASAILLKKIGYEVIGCTMNLLDDPNEEAIRDAKKVCEKLEIASKKDSQEICFIKDNNYQRFLKEYMQKQPKRGEIVLTTGERLGKHDGLINYTIGQRKGLGISYKEPLYVVKLDINNNQVIVGTEKELYNGELKVINLNWIVDIENKLEEGLQCLAKIRYRAKEARAKVIKENDSIKVIFEEPQRAITSGQSVVFYDEDGIVLGGGKIV